MSAADYIHPVERYVMLRTEFNFRLAVWHPPKSFFRWWCDVMTPDITVNIKRICLKLVKSMKKQGVKKNKAEKSQ